MNNPGMKQPVINNQDMKKTGIHNQSMCGPAAKKRLLGLFPRFVAGGSGTIVSLSCLAICFSIIQAEPVMALPVDPVDPDINHLRNLISFSKIFLSAFVLILAWFLNRLLSGILDHMAERFSGYRLFVKRLTPVIRILLWSFALYVVIAGIISPPFETVITISASIGIAVGFASQDILKNVFGGIMIILDRPFQVGDKIQVGDHYGEVKSIGLRSSQIETPDDSVVSIPNGELMNRAVSNANSSALDCQVVTEIYFPATVDIMAIKDIARRAVYSSPYLYLNKPVEIISLNKVNNRYFMVKFRVKAYVLDIRYEFLFKSDVTEMIITECTKRGFIPEKQPETAGSTG